MKDDFVRGDRDSIVCGDGGQGGAGWGNHNSSTVGVGAAMQALKVSTMESELELKV